MEGQRPCAFPRQVRGDWGPAEPSPALRKETAKETEARLLQNSIEWKYFENDTYVPFNSFTNVDLEKAYQGEQKTVVVTIGERIYTVDMDRKTAVDAQGGQIPIIRIDKSEDQKSVVLPPTWDPVENERVKIVELKPDSREYKDVEERFRQTCQSFKIEKIERVQNRYFWETYQIKKRQMDKKNGDRNNERLLFHGTSQEFLSSINKHGFNRGYAGMHALNFGNGTYFAVNASYSAQDLYSKPDANGKKYMYLARVLVGEYSQGKRGSFTPSPKNASNPVDLFDSSTDNVNQPSIFIIFNDIQAYPEYLITFTNLTNMDLENAYQAKQKTMGVTIGERIYTVDMDCKTAVDAQGGQIPIIRIDKSEDQKSVVLPPTWDPVENERVKIVELKPDSREYKDVEERFRQTCQSFKIEKIERVQNRYFWETYQIKKRQMDKKNGDRNNERLLFHGTSQEFLSSINKHGFNRGYAGMHALNFGNGTYFAVNASYSAQDLYSKPDANGKKYMYLARVLVGEYSQGKKGSFTPSPKNASNPVDLFDSSTDNVNQPSIFIIFNDIQAYPEYLITFTK